MVVCHVVKTGVCVCERTHSFVQTKGKGPAFHPPPKVCVCGDRRGVSSEVKGQSHIVRDLDTHRPLRSA